jgi:hypothetical protein
MKTFNTLGYEVVPNAIDSFTAKLLATEFEMLRDNTYRENNVDLSKVGLSNDWQVKDCFSWYSPYCFESLLLLMKPVIEEVTGKKLLPAYSYARIYYNGATMQKHVDRESCQYSVSMTIDVDESGPWEIWMRDFRGEAKPFILPVGSMVVYRGDKLEHWREDPYKGKKQIQAFLHYVDSNGQYKDHAFDFRPMLGAPSAKGN